jgi:ABC-type Fe3+ transport system substrate-binding protein
MGLLEGASSFGFDLDAESDAAGGWGFLGGAPVPLRRRIREEVARRAQQNGAPLNCDFPLSPGSRGPFERLRRIRTLRDFPAMLASCDGPNAFNRRFHAEHVETGAFAALQPGGAPGALADLVDPKGWIGVYAVAPFVMLIDHERLDGRPVPRRWSDLVDPVYRGEVVFGGWRPEGETRFHSVNTFFLVSMRRRLGLAGLKALLRNVPTLMHSAQMPRFAATSASVGSVYVLPWLLAQLCPRRSMTQVVWPEDGALAYPLWLTVQAHRQRELQPLVDLFYGADLAGYLNDNLYPALSPQSQPQIPASGVSWLGWDYLRSRHAAADHKAARAAFAEIVPCG